jgi:hypothetical protein
MDLINFLGSKLSELTGKYQYGCSALIILSLKDMGKEPTSVTFQEFTEAFQIHLFRRLEFLGVESPDEIIRKMVAILNEKQSWFTVSAH